MEGSLGCHPRRRWRRTVASVTQIPKSMPSAQPPLILSWDQSQAPLPLRAIRAATRPIALGIDAAPWVTSGAAGQPFDFCGHVRRLCGDITARCPELYHIDTARLLFAVTQARTANSHGLQARVTPLRFRGGGLTRRRRGTTFQVQRYLVGRREMLYLVTFCLPRFLDLDFDEKFVTVFHELFHISPAFDGDLRRHSGRYAIHSRSQRHYDRHMADLARAYLASGADRSLHGFLRLNFAQLQGRHGSVVGVIVPRPKLIPVAAKR